MNYGDTVTDEYGHISQRLAIILLTRLISKLSASIYTSLNTAPATQTEPRLLLPISEFLPQINALLSAKNSLILQAEPGAGKSTALPLSLLDARWLNGKKIIMLEPRRVAAKSIAHYLASQLGEKVGQRIGYQVKNDRKVSKDTVLEIVTEGILTRRLQGNPELSEYGLIIFDEFHERSLHADLALMLALEIQQTIRVDLKLLVMSATIDTQAIANYMGGAEIIECPGRVFPVSLNYTKNSKAPLSQQVTDILEQILHSESQGDTLVFLPGQADIRRCLSAAQGTFRSTEIIFLPLYGALSIAQQEQALCPDPDGKRRVIFSTNIAETSLTIEGVTYVIDSGLEKTLIYDSASGMTRLETTYISKASAEQRKGRAGRTQAGTCVRLWDQQRHNTLKDFKAEEIVSSDLSDFVLELFLWGSKDFNEIHWLTQPPRHHFESAKKTLRSLALIDDSDEVTPLGNKTSSIGLPARLSSMLLRASDKVEKGLASELATLLADKDIFSRQNGNNRGVDIVDRMLAIQDYKNNRNKALKEHSINRAAIEQLLVSAKGLGKTIRAEQNIQYSLTQINQSIGRLMLLAYPDRLAKRRSNNCGRYQLANGKGVFLHDNDPLFGAEWLIVADCDGQKKEGRIYSAALVSYDCVLECLGEQLVEDEEYSLDKNKQKIIARCNTSFGAIQIKSTTISALTPEKFQQCLIQIIQENGVDILNWTDKCNHWLARVQWLGKHLAEFPQISKDSLAQTVATWLLPYTSNISSIAELKRINILELLAAILSWDDQQRLESEAPVNYLAPSGKTLPITYHDNRGPTVSVVLQEMFGQVESPKLANGNVPLTFELLSPARRPIQTTSDLGNFWQTSYFEVIKDMKGRYPRHRWPDEPMLEKPGKSYRPRTKT